MNEATEDARTAPDETIVTRRLSPREIETLVVYAETADQRQTAEAMGLSVQTVKNMCYSAYKKLNVTNNIEAFRAIGLLVTDHAPARVALADIEARLSAIHAESGALLAELRREAA